MTPPSAAPTKGIFAALWLPTDADGNLLRDELARNLAFLKQHHIAGVLALGSTGEFPQFDLGQRKAALATIWHSHADVHISQIKWFAARSNQIS